MTGGNTRSLKAQMHWRTHVFTYTDKGMLLKTHYGYDKSLKDIMTSQFPG